MFEWGALKFLLQQLLQKTGLEAVCAKPHSVSPNSIFCAVALSSPDLLIMAKRVEYLRSSSTERAREDLWFDYGRFILDEFTGPDITFSSFDDECPDENVAPVFLYRNEWRGRILSFVEHLQPHQELR